MRFSSARQMIFDAYQAQRGSVMASASEIMRLGARVQHSRRQNNDWRICDGMESGQVIAAVERQPEHLQAVARLFWGPFTPEESAADRERVHMALVQAMQGRRLPGQGGSQYPTAEAWEMLKTLAWAAIHHHGETTHPYGRTGLPGPRAIKRWIEEERGQSINVTRWNATGRRCWADIWRHLLTVLDDWEAQALGPVAELTRLAA